MKNIKEMTEQELLALPCSGFLKADWIVHQIGDGTEGRLTRVHIPGLDPEVLFSVSDPRKPEGSQLLFSVNLSEADWARFKRFIAECDPAPMTSETEPFEPAPERPSGI